MPASNWRIYTIEAVRDHTQETWLTFVQDWQEYLNHAKAHGHTVDSIRFEAEGTCHGDKFEAAIARMGVAYERGAGDSHESVGQAEVKGDIIIIMRVASYPATG